MIYLKLEKQPESFTEIIDTLYDVEKSLYSLVQTYRDRECTILQCDKNKRRSFQDLFEIGRTYFPKLTINEFIIYLKNKKLGYYFCSHINRVVFHFCNYENVDHKFVDYLKLIYHSSPEALKHIDDLQKFIDKANEQSN